MLSAINNKMVSSSKEGNSTWCLAYINENKIKVEVIHVGRGRFRILDDENDSNKYVNKIIDASDIYHCKE
jgi:hypothetical protein